MADDAATDIQAAPVVPSAGAVVASTILEVLGSSDANAALASFIGGIITPIIRQEIKDAFQEAFSKTGEVGKPIDALQRDFDN